MTPEPPVRVTLTGVRSLTHLVYAASFLRHLLTERAGPVQVGVYDLGDGFGRSRVSADDVLALLPDDPSLTIDPDLSGGGRVADHFTVVADRSRVLLSVGAPGLRVWRRMVRAGRGHRPRVVVLDEGIGSFGDLRTRLAAYRRQGGSGPWPVVRAAAVSGGNRVLTDERWSLYRRDGGRWVVDERVAREFRDRVQGEPAAPGTAVYLGQPWPELGVMTERDYLDHLHVVAEACDAAGLALVVRPHPSEDPGRYAGLARSSSGVPAELDRAAVTARVVIGSHSTALLNLAAVHGVPAVRVTAPGLSGLDRALGSRQRALFDTFLPLAADPEGLRSALGRALG
ncbi:MAG: polysialyltransferase family glycosyltransferase [Terracoccus sp.]